MKRLSLLLLSLIVSNGLLANPGHSSAKEETKKLNTISTQYNSTDKQAKYQSTQHSQHASQYNQGTRHSSGYEDVLVCESINHRRNHCYADTRGGVRLIRQLSRANCYNNWGYDYQGIWVINGCRAEFALDRYDDYFDDDEEVVRCESNNYRRQFCYAGLRNSRVYILHQLSHSDCRGNWGYDRNGIWVDDGCRADFAIERYDYPVSSGGEIIRCESRNYQNRRCPADTYGGVEFYEQHSKRSCEGRWGYDRNGIWVTDGCRASFKLLGGYDDDYNPFGHDPYGYGGRHERPRDYPVDAPVGEVSIITCESHERRRAYCRVNTTGGVELDRQISRSSCNGNWGYDRNGIWVDNGCRARFAVGTPRSHSRSRTGSGLPVLHDTPDNYDIVRCESKNHTRQICNIGRHRNVEFHDQLSRSSCERQWGTSGRNIWVDNGCRAKFKVYR